MTTSASSFAKDAGERSLRSAIGAIAGIAVIELTALENALTGDNPLDLGAGANALIPMIVIGLSLLTSWLSKFRGDPSSASARKAG